MDSPPPPSYPAPTGREPRLFEKAYRTKASKIAFYVLDEEGSLVRVTISDLKALLSLE